MRSHDIRVYTYNVCRSLCVGGQLCTCYVCTVKTLHVFNFPNNMHVTLILHTVMKLWTQLLRSSCFVCFVCVSICWRQYSNVAIATLPLTTHPHQWVLIHTFTFAVNSHLYYKLSRRIHQVVATAATERWVVRREIHERKEREHVVAIPKVGQYGSVGEGRRGNQPGSVSSFDGCSLKVNTISGLSVCKTRALGK